MAVITPFEARVPAARSVVDGLDVLSVAIPMSLGSAVILYGQVAPGHLGAGLMAACLGLLLVYGLSAFSARPVVHAGRFFEAATLAAMVLHLAGEARALGVPDSAGLRVAMVCVIVGGAGALTALLALVRAERFARFIPAPVFVGFTMSVAALVVMTQTVALQQTLAQATDPWPLLVVVGTLAVGLAVRHWRPRWPPAMCALVAGTVAGVLLAAGGVALPRLTDSNAFTLPVAVADFSALQAAAAAHPALALALARDAATLAILLFLNTVVTGQMLAQTDDRVAPRRADQLLLAGAMTAAGAAGASPVSGAPNIALLVSRRTVVTPGLMLTVAVGASLLYLSGALTLVPMAALIGGFFFEAWTMWDRPAVRHAWALLRRRAVPPNVRGDLLLIAAVMAASLAVNMVAGLAVGLVLGLLLHALRHTRRPVRTVSDGATRRSRCARAPDEMALLAAHATRLRVFELDSHQFFASAAQLNATVRAQLPEVDAAVLDWRAVDEVDTSVAMVVVRLEAYAQRVGAVLLHAGAGRGPGSVAEVLAQHVPAARLCPDLDRALQQAEDVLIERHGGARAAPAAAAGEGDAEDPATARLLRGLAEEDRSHVQQMLRPRELQAGDWLLRAGEPSDELLLVRAGTASVVVPGEGGDDVRLSGVRAGATVGEIGFLDRAPRSAGVRADGPVRLLVLQRADFDTLARERPQAVQQLLVNLSLDLAARVRHLSGLVAARPGG